MAKEEEGVIAFKWNNHRDIFFNVLTSLRAKEICTDATLGCDGKLYPVHKIVLCASSDYFCDIFRETNCKSPVIILKDVHHHNLEALLDYMYHGEVEILEKDLPDLLQAAECLHIKGLGVPEDDVLSHTKELSPIKKEVIEEKVTPKTYSRSAASKLTPTDHNEYSCITNLNDSEINSSNTACEREIVEPPLKRPKKENEKVLKFNDSKTFSSLISKNFCKTVPLISHATKLQTSLHLSPESSRQKIKSENKTIPSNPSTKREQLKRKTNLKRTLSMKKPIVFNCNSDKSGEAFCSAFSESQFSNQKVKHIKVENSSLGDKVNRTLNCENKEEGSSLQSSDNVGVNHVDETEYDDKTLKSQARMNKKVEEDRVCEEFCDEIGLPTFSESVIPYVEGHKLETKEERILGNKLIDELKDHLLLHNMLERIPSAKLRGIFYYVIQLKIVEKFPNIIREGSSRKNIRKGPLGLLITKLTNKLCSYAKKNKCTAEQNDDSTSGNIEAEINMHLENMDESQEKENIGDIVVQDHHSCTESNSVNMEAQTVIIKQDKDGNVYVEPRNIVPGANVLNFFLPK